MALFCHGMRDNGNSDKIYTWSLCLWQITMSLSVSCQWPFSPHLTRCSSEWIRHNLHLCCYLVFPVKLLSTYFLLLYFSSMQFVEREKESVLQWCCPPWLSQVWKTVRMLLHTGTPHSFPATVHIQHFKMREPWNHIISWWGLSCRDVVHEDVGVISEVLPRISCPPVVKMA